jgi:hypothetical protein
MERFNLKKLNAVEGTEQYCVENANRFAALENIDREVDVNKARETIRENINISAKEGLGYYELKKNKQKFDEGCPKLLDQKKQQRYWVFGLCPSSGFFLNKNEKTQRFGNWICFRPQVREDTYSVGPLRKS